MKTLVLSLIAVLFSGATFAQVVKNSEKYEFPSDTREFLRLIFPDDNNKNTLYIINTSKEEIGKKHQKARYITSTRGTNGKLIEVEADIAETDIILVYNRTPWYNTTKKQLLVADEVINESQYAKNDRQRDGQGLERVMGGAGKVIQIGGAVLDEIDYRRGRPSRRSGNATQVGWGLGL
ncbi:MAG TPA: hypothetical protein VGE18_03415 [Candidatus Paceibacterota bacterium]